MNKPMEIQLTKGAVTLIDEADFDLVRKHAWYVMKSPRSSYAGTSIYENGKQKTIRLHRLILGVTESKLQVDHIDGNGLNNRRSNLRVCSSAQNMMNKRKYLNSTSGIKGVYAVRNKWRAIITHKGDRFNLGLFEQREDAAKAYDMAARNLFGEFANLNMTEVCDE